MNNLYVRLAKNNLKNNKSLYVPYMVAGMITVLMFYIMMFINNSAGLEKMRGAFYITTIMSFGVIVVGVFSYIYIFYTNSFISKRRKKEMGIYNILGMEKRHIAKVLAIETVFTAFVSIVGGIVAGILFSKLALMLIYRILGIQVTIEFSVPPSAVKNTVLVFGILYMMTLFYNLMQMKLANPVELLRGSSVGEKEPKTKWLMAILGVVCLGAGYAIAITTEQPMKVISLFFVAVLLVIAGTYMLFTAGSIAVLKLLRKTHGFYYKKKHFIAVSTMMYRMKQNAAGLASICILSTMVMVMVSTTVCMFVGFDDEINILYPYEINVQTGYSEVKENVSEQSSDIIQFIEDTGTNVTDSESYSYLNFAMTLEKDSLTIGQKPTNASLYFLTRDNFLRMDHTLTEADVPKVEAGKILIFREKRFQSTKTLRGDQIQILGETFTVQQNGYCKNRSNGGAISFMDGVYYIVVDHMQTLQKLQKLAIAEANTENVSAYAYENVLGINITGTETEKIACSGNVENYSSGEKYGVVWRRVRGRAVNRKELLALYGGFFFLGIFLGTVFLAVTVMIIFYKQVSEGYEDKERYRIMEQVGMSNVEVKSAKSLMLPALRSSEACVCTSRLSRERGCRSLSLPSQVTDSTDLLSASPRNRELDRMWHRRCAADGESRRKPRYSLSVPKCSSSLRQLSSPMSGFCPSPSHWRAAGRRMRLIFAAREMPAVSAVTWRMAASGSANPMEAKRSCMALADSSTCSSSRPALMGSMGR